MCGKLTGWNLQSRAGTKCFAVNPIFFLFRLPRPATLVNCVVYDSRIFFCQKKNCRILHTTVSRVFSHNTRRFSIYHPYVSILLNVIQTCINVYTIEVHGLGTRGPPTHQPHNFAKSFPPWSVGSSSAPLWVTLTNCVLCSANVFLSVLAYFYVILLWLLQKNYVFYVLVFRNSENLLFLDYFL
jgi:hypothetical protein